MAQVTASPSIVLCDVHKEEEVRLYCKNCNCLVCNECVVDQHVGHTFQRIKDIAEEKRRQVTKTLDNIENNILPEVRERIEKTRHIKREHSKNGTTLIQDITKRANVLIAEVEKVKNELIEELNTLQSADQKKLCEFEQTMNGIFSNAEEAIVLFRSELKSSQDANIVKMESELDAEVKEIAEQIRDVPSVNYTVFVAGTQIDESIQLLFGRCLDQDQCEAETSSDILPPQPNSHVIETKLGVVSSFQHETDKGTIQDIKTLDDQSAWIATYLGKEIKRVNQAGRVDKTLTFFTTVKDLAITDDGSLLATPGGGSGGHEYQIKKVKPNGDIVTFVDMKPLRPSCICVAKTGHLYVGCIDRVNYGVTDKSTRSVTKLSGAGIIQQSYQCDNNEQRLFTLPTKIQENINGDVWVFDRTAILGGRIVVIQQDGKVKFIYTGAEYNKIIHNIMPNDLTAVGDGTMLIADVYNDIIHALDENGTPLYFLGSQHTTGIYGPTAICLNRKNDMLWVGNRKGKIQILRMT